MRARFLATLAIVPVLALSALAIDPDARRAALGGHSKPLALAIHEQLVHLRGVHPDARRALVAEAAVAEGVRRVSAPRHPRSGE